ncbi:MAG: apolipoprotein A1/A4/E family protein [Lachnospiraceae bacterium]|nr:apolipoprotein A1/A4/E family protein [Lachnospiraceae bacterium]
MAESNAGEIKLGVGLSTDPLQEQAPKVEKTAEKVGKSIGEAVDKGSTETLKKASEKIGKTAEKTGTESGRKFTGGFKKGIDGGSGGIIASAVKLAGKLAAVFAGKKIFDFGKAAIEAGSDLSEVQNVVDSTFTSMGDKVDEFAQNAATKFGLSETMAKRYAGTFGAMGKAFGFSEEKAYDMSTALTGLAGDVASFYNITQDEAYTKLKSVFTGETESLKDLGVVMTQTALDDYALRSGLGKTVQQMSEAEKVTLRYGFVMDQLSTASGDFSRTADGWANQVRILTLQFQSLKAAIGQGLIAALNPVIHAVNRFMAVLVKAANVFSAFMQKLFGVKAAAGAMGSAVSGAIDNITGGTADAINGIDGVGNAASGAAKKATKAVQQLKRTLEGFDQITKVKETADAAAGSSGSGGGGGAGGGIGGSDAGAMEDFASATEAAGESMSKLDAIVERFKEKLDPARKALERLREQLEKLGGHLGEGLKWIYDNVLVPLADWTITEVIPRFFDTLANVLHILDGVLVALQPLWQWFWDNVLKPVAAWTADAFIWVWDRINELLAKFADWCDKNPDKIRIAAAAIGAFIAVLSGSGPIILICKNWDKIKAVGEKLWKSIKRAVADIKNKFKDIRTKLGGFVKAVKEKFEDIIEKVNEFWDGIKKIPENVKTTISLAKSSLFDKVKKEWDSIKDKTAEIKAKVCQFKDELKNKVIEFQAKLSTWKEGLKNKIIEFQAKLDTWKEALSNKVINFQAKMNTWKEALKNKVVNFQARMNTWKEALSNKVINFQARMNTWKESLSSKVINFQARMNTWKESLNNKIINFQAKLTTWRDSLNDKVINFRAKLTSWTDSLSNKVISFVANITGRRADGGVYDNKTWKPIQRYAAGGSPEGGQMFIAREKGPELVGTLGGHTAVMNNDQIVASVSAGVAKAISGIKFYGENRASMTSDRYLPHLADVGNGIRQDLAPLVQLARSAESAQASGGIAEMVQILRQILRLLETLDFDVKIDGKSLKDRIVKLINENTQATGVCEIIV